MGYDDAPDTSAYPTCLLSCGHTQRVAPDTARKSQSSPAVRVWCKRCALNVSVREVAPASTEHEHSREESGRLIRVVCSCGWKGRWRSRGAFLVEKQLHSDDGEHLYAVRRETP